jgi:integrase
LKLTEKYLQNVKVTKRTDKGTDRKNLLLRLAPNRGRTVKTLRYRYWRDGKALYVQLGDYGPDFTVADIYDLYGRCLAADSRGEDPEATKNVYWSERAPRPAADVDGPTVSDVVTEFLTVTRRKRPEQAKYLLEANVLPSLGHRSVAGLRKRDIVECYDKITRRGSLVLANRVDAVLRQAFAIAADRDLIESIPIFPRLPPGGEESVRTRVLAEGEIRTLWHGLDTLSLGEGIKDHRGEIVKVHRPLVLALKLQLVTAQRRGEVAAARWSDIVDRVWSMPASAKRGKRNENLMHRVPLSPLAEGLLDEMRTLAEDSNYWLPSSRTGKLATDRARSISKAAREARKALKMTNWRPHDLRRTARTFMAKLGVTEEVAERVLGHGSEDPMVLVYNQHPYIDEMRTALERWATELQRIVQ